MRGKKSLRQKQSFNKNEGFADLLEVHTLALENNSKSLIEILEILSEKELSYKDKEALKKIKRELKGIDNKVDSLGVSKDDEERWW